MYCPDNKPIVSVIVPNYNHAAYLERRINSILTQTFQNFELILLDDCSSDDSREILLKYKDHLKVTHVVLNEQNSGNTFRQWSKGLELASADIIWLAESDDWAEPTFLEELVPPLLDNLNINISFCQTLCVDSNGKILYKTDSDTLYEVKTGKEFVANSMFYGNRIMNASMAVFRKSSMENIDWAFSSMRFCGDWYLWVQLALAGEVFESGKYLSYFFKHGQDVTSKAVTQGLFFTEGYKIMLYIKQNVKTNTYRDQKNIDYLINYYLTQKPLFIDDETNKKVLNSLELVQSDIKSLIKRRENKIRIKQIMSKIFYLR